MRSPQSLQDQFKAVLESSMAEVQVLARNPKLPTTIAVYAKVIAAFLAGDGETLQQLVLSFPTFKNEICTEFGETFYTELQQLCELRLAVRKRQIAATDLKRLEAGPQNELIQAELAFVSALGWHQLGEEQSAHQQFLRAASLYQHNGCPKRHLRAFYNAIASESRIRPYKNFVLEYQAVVELSQRFGDLSFAGVALAMISRELQILGLHEEALRKINESLIDLEPEMGSLHYGYAVLQKAHLLFELGRMEEAKAQCKLSTLASFPEVYAIRKLLEFAMDPRLGWDTALEKQLPPTWSERLPELLQTQDQVVPANVPLTSPLTSLETKLLKLLWNGPVAKWELIEKLYPGVQDSTLIENRFKNLASRIRSKLPDLLQQKEGRYFLASRHKPEVAVQMESAL